MRYAPTKEGNDAVPIAMFWWSELAADERKEILRVFAPLQTLCKGLGEAGIAELVFKLLHKFSDEDLKTVV